MPLLLRPVLPKDETFLYQLAYENMFEQLAAWAWDPQYREPLLKMQIVGQNSAYAAEFPNANHGIILLDDKPVGRMILDRGPEIHYLVDITILKQYRGAGIGTRLIQALCTEAEMLRKRVRLQVMVTNRAKGLYERLGFRLIEDRQVAWLMERAPGSGSLMAGAP